MQTKASTLLPFGATGDLARRMLLPSLYGLDSDGLLPAGLRIVATARTKLDDDEFRELAHRAPKSIFPTASCRRALPSGSSRACPTCR